MIRNFISNRLSGVSNSNGISDDRGLSLPEVLIAIGLSGLLALGCTQLAMASFSSANYTQSVAVTSLNTGNLNRLITNDVEKSDGFIVSSTNVATQSAFACSTATLSTGNSIRPLFTVTNNDGSAFGYEVRTTGNDGALWRISCPSQGVSNGPSQQLRSSLPVSTSSTWDTSVMCAHFPAGGNLTPVACEKDSLLNAIATNPGILITVPASVSGTKVNVQAQIIVAGRNIT